MLTAMPLGLGSNPGKDMDVCKCIVPSRHGGTLNRRRVTSPLVRLVEGEKRNQRRRCGRALPAVGGLINREKNAGVVSAVCEATTQLLAAGLAPAKAVFIDSQAAISALSSAL
ncbi:hypothetical protein TNCV_2642471 [Trichonephila clavipes]|nr:hypothetical protein TNCV_2642471 [Trichonephila clavipes]